MATRGNEGAREGFGVGLANIGSQIIDYKMNQSMNAENMAGRAKIQEESDERTHANRASELQLTNQLAGDRDAASDERTLKREEALLRLRSKFGMGTAPGKTDSAFDKTVKVGGGVSGDPEKVIITGNDGSILQYDPSTNTVAKAGEGTGISMDQSGELMNDARSYADEKVDRKAGFFSSDSSDFKEQGGDRESARDQFMKEYLESRKGLINGSKPSDSNAQPSSASPQAPAGPAPVQISTQEDYESLPSGTQFINPADGSVLTKP